MWPILSMIAGLALLLTGVVALFAYAWTRPTSSVVAVDGGAAGAPPFLITTPDAGVAPPPPPSDEPDASVEAEQPDAAATATMTPGSPASRPPTPALR